MEYIYPASPNWYCSRVIDANNDGIFIFGAKHSLYVFDVSQPKQLRFIRHVPAHDERVVGVSICRPATALSAASTNSVIGISAGAASKSAVFDTITAKPAAANNGDSTSAFDTVAANNSATATEAADSNYAAVDISVSVSSDMAAAAETAAAWATATGALAAITPGAPTSATGSTAAAAATGAKAAAGPAAIAGLRVCSAGEDGKVKVWDVDKADLVLEHSLHRAKPTTVHWSPADPNLIASGDDRGGIVVYNISQREGWTWHPEHPHTHIFSLEFSPHYKTRLAVGFKTGAIMILDVSQRNNPVLARLRGHDDEVHSLVWFPAFEGNTTFLGEEFSGCPVYDLIASSCRDKTIRVWNAAKSQCVQMLRLPGQSRGRDREESGGYRQRGWIALVWLTSAGKTDLISSGCNGELMRWNLSDVQSKQKFHILSQGKNTLSHSRMVFNITTVACSHGNSLLVSTSMDRQIIIWDAAAASAVLSIPSFGGFVYSIAPSPLDPGRCAVGVGDNLIRLCSTVDPYNVQTYWQGIRSKVTTLAWHPTKEGLLGYGTEDGRVGILDVLASKSTVVSCTYHKRTVYVVTWGEPLHENSSHSDDIFSVEETVLSLYSVGDGVILEHSMENFGQLPAKDITPLLQKASNQIADNFEANGGAKRTHSAMKTEMSWKPDLSHFAIGFEDGRIEIFAIKPSLVQICIIRVHRKLINCIRWHPKFTITSTEPSPYQYLLATGSNEAVVNIFNLEQVITSQRILSNSKDIIKKAGTNVEEKRTANETVIEESGTEGLVTEEVVVEEMAASTNVAKGTVPCGTVPTIMESYWHLDGHTNKITALSWSSHEDGLLASASYDWTVQVWDIKRLDSRGSYNKAVELNKAQTIKDTLVAVESCEILNNGSVVNKASCLLDNSGQTSKDSLNIIESNSGGILRDESVVYGASFTNSLSSEKVLPSNGDMRKDLTNKQLVAEESAKSTTEKGSKGSPQTGSGHFIANFRGHSGRLMSVAWSAVDPDVIYSGADDYALMAWRVSCQVDTKPPEVKRRLRSLRPKGKSIPKEQVDQAKDSSNITTVENIVDSLCAESINAELKEDERVELRALLEAKRQSLQARNEKSIVAVNNTTIATSNRTDKQVVLREDRESDSDSDSNWTVGGVSGRKFEKSPESNIAIYRKKRAGRKSLFPKANSADNRGKQPTQQDCIELTKFKYGATISSTAESKVGNSALTKSFKKGTGEPKSSVSDSSKDLQKPFVSESEVGNSPTKSDKNATATEESNLESHIKSDKNGTGELKLKLSGTSSKAPMKGLEKHLGCFSDRRLMLAQCREEEAHHRERKSFEALLMLQTFRGATGEVVTEAMEEKWLDDFSVALAAGVSLEAWEAACESYSKQLTSEGFYHKAATYLVAVNKIHAAVQLLRDHALYRDAVSLARLRLSPTDPLIKDVTSSWGHNLLRDGNYELAAKCFVAVGDPAEASSCLARRADKDSMRSAALIALSANLVELSLSHAQKYVLEGLLVGDWMPVMEFVASNMEYRYFGLLACSYMLLVWRLAEEDFGCSVFESLPPENWITIPLSDDFSVIAEKNAKKIGENTAKSGENVALAGGEKNQLINKDLETSGGGYLSVNKDFEPISLPKNTTGGGDNLQASSANGKTNGSFTLNIISTLPLHLQCLDTSFEAGPWKALLVHGKPLFLHLILCWAHHLGLDINSTDHDELYSRLLSIRRGRQSNDTLPKLLLSASADIALGVLMLLKPEMLDEASRMFVEAAACLAAGVPKKAGENIVRLILPATSPLLESTLATLRQVGLLQASSGGMLVEAFDKDLIVEKIASTLKQIGLMQQSVESKNEAGGNREHVADTG